MKRTARLLVNYSVTILDDIRIFFLSSFISILAARCIVFRSLHKIALNYFSISWRHLTGPITADNIFLTHHTTSRRSVTATTCHTGNISLDSGISQENDTRICTHFPSITSVVFTTNAPSLYFCSIQVLLSKVPEVLLSYVSRRNLE